MTEHISKNLARRAALAPCNKCWKESGKTPVCDDCKLYGVAQAIDRIPAADVREVVLCKDCVYYIRGKLFGDMVCDYHYLHQYHAEPNEYCSHGEKR